MLSFIGLILLVTQSFAGFYLTGYGNRWSCFACDYTTAGDLAAQIIILIALIIQIIIALNDLAPKRFIDKDLEVIGLLLNVIIIIMVIAGYLAFMITYFEYDSWPATGFYAGIVVGILNTILFYLKYKNK